MTTSGDSSDESPISQAIIARAARYRRVTKERFGQRADFLEHLVIVTVLMLFFFAEVSVTAHRAPFQAGASQAAAADMSMSYISTWLLESGIDTSKLNGPITDANLRAWHWSAPHVFADPVLGKPFILQSTQNGYVIIAPGPYEARDLAAFIPATHIVAGPCAQNCNLRELRWYSADGPGNPEGGDMSMPVDPSRLSNAIELRRGVVLDDILDIVVGFVGALLVIANVRRFGGLLLAGLAVFGFAVAFVLCAYLLPHGEAWAWITGFAAMWIAPFAYSLRRS